MDRYICPFVVLVMIIPMNHARIWEVSIPKYLQSCYSQVKDEDVGTFVESTFCWFCESAVRSGRHKKQVFTQQQLRYFHHLSRGIGEQVEKLKHGRQLHGHFSEPIHHEHIHRRKRQTSTSKCTRREYRKMSDHERNAFHHAVNVLKHDTSVHPNKYDALALLHTSEGIKSAHDGAGFPGWHRIYILMFEVALREVNPSVCLPYWDSSLDEGLDDPVTSQVWSDEFFGSPHGAVVTGPFANWTTPSGVPLLRDVGSDGDLISANSVRDVLSRRSHEDILSSRRSSPRYRLEHHHNDVHKFVGGTMDKLDGAAFDPIFFLHHAFIDFVWERFRANLRRRGRDPEVYPEERRCRRRSRSRRNKHCSISPMRIAEITQGDGYKDIWTSHYEYEPSPDCQTATHDCGSVYLKCDTDAHRCLPIVRTRREKRSINNETTNIHSYMELTQPSHHSQHAQNSPSLDVTVPNDFCCNGVCDINRWINIPVIIATRAANINMSFPHPKTYRRCSIDKNISGVFITSRGINYSGFYKEYIRVDGAHPASLALGFIKVMNPERSSRGVTTALLRAHDSCGRMCHSVCRDQATGSARSCSGAVAMDTKQPLMYGETVDDAVMELYRNMSRLPVFEHVFITFYCDYQSDFLTSTYEKV